MMLLASSFVLDSKSGA